MVEIASTSAALGPNTPAASSSVIQAGSTTATLTNVAASASSVTVLASNTGRLFAAILNDSTSIGRFKFGAVASISSFTVLLQGGDYYEVPTGYRGQIDGIWESATGNARVTEVA